MTDYCSAIQALFAENRKLPRLTADTNRTERWRINAIHAGIHRQTRELQQQAAEEFAALNGWRHIERDFSIKTLIRGGAHAARGEWPIYLDPHNLLDLVAQSNSHATTRG